MRGVSVGGGGGVDDRVMCFSINWSINASEDWFLFRPCVGSGWGDGDRFRGFTYDMSIATPTSSKYTGLVISSRRA